MTLTAHAITGAALASLVPDQPLVGFAVGFISHFVLDAIPHWDYKLSSKKEDGNNHMNDDMVINKNFIKDILKISFDGILGLLFAYFIFVFFILNFLPLLFLSGVIGAMMPDALQFVYMKWRHEPLISLQKFHLWIHADKKIIEKLP